jgi:hypothetical protein
MSLETATTIAGLVNTNPTPSDAVSQGDDHLRLIKSVLKTQFPGVAAAGFAIPITAKETELNYLVGVTSAIQAQLNGTAFHASLASATASSGVDTKLMFDSIQYDTETAYDIPSGNLTPKVLGWYQVNASFKCQGAPLTLGALYIRKDGLDQATSLVAAPFTNPLFLTASALIHVDGSTSKLSVVANIAGTGTLTISNAYFSASLMARG